MKLAYVAGPYRAETIYECGQNIAAARGVAVELWRMGWAVICPHMNSSYLDGAADDSVWLAGGLEMLSRSDALVLIPGWRRSEGSVAEFEAAMEMGLPTYEWEHHRELLKEAA